MSVVVAIKENGKVYIGADSQVTRGGTRTTLKNENNYKIWRVIGAPHCLMAQVGTLRDANVVRLMPNLVTDYNIYREHIGFDFVVKKVVPDIVEELTKYGFLKEGEKKKDYHLGRCDIGSAFACGIPFDVIEDVIPDKNNG